MNLFETILRHRSIALLMAVGILVGGGLAWRDLPVDAFPDVTGVQVLITSRSDGLSSEEMERIVTIQVEGTMGGLPGFSEVRSLSKGSLSLVTVVFDDDKDIDLARQEVSQRLDSIRDALPPTVDLEMGPKMSALGEIFQYTLQTGWTCPDHPEVWQDEAGTCPHDEHTLVRPSYSSAELRAVQDWTVARHLLRVRGVTEVNSYGGEVRQIDILPDPDLLIAQGLTLGDIEAAVAAAGTNVGGGFIDDGEERHYVVGHGRFQTAKDIGRLLLKSVNGTSVRVDQVAEIREGHVPRYGSITRDGEGETVGGVVMLLQGANAQEVVARIHDAILELEPALPHGVRVAPFYDRTLLTDASVNTVSEALLIGGALVILILLLFLWDLRSALVVALSLPLTASMVFLTMRWADISANLMTLWGLAIAIGMIGDGAIVVVEAMVRAGRTGNRSLARRAATLAEVARPVFFSILVIVSVLLPLLSLQGLEGKMFRPMAVTIAFAMLSSIVVSLLVIPGLGSFIPQRAKGLNPAERFLLAGYRPLLRWSLRHRPAVTAVALACLAGAGAIVPTLGTEFLPTFDEGTLTTLVSRNPTASLATSTRLGTWVEREILARVPEVKGAVTKAGRPEIAIDEHGPETLETVITLKDPAEWRPGVDQQQIMTEISTILEEIPGASGFVSQPIEHRVHHMVSGIKATVALKVFGDDLDQLTKIAAALDPLLEGIPGAADISVEPVTGQIQYDVIPNIDALGPNGLDIADVTEVVELGIRGRIAGTWYDGERRIPIRIRLPKHHRSSRYALGRIPMTSRRGERVLLGDVATITTSKPPARISREGFQRRVVVECNVRGRDLGGFVAAVQEALVPFRRDLPTGYRIDIAGEFENQQRATERLALILPVVLGLILLLQLAALGSMRSTLLVLMNLPFSVVGGILMIKLLDIHVSVSVLVGLIALFGMAVQHGTILVATINHRRDKGATIDEAVVEASHVRLRPLLMTKLTSLFGLLPMLLATGPGADMQRPLAAVVLGGLLFTTLLNLFVVPALYPWFHPQERSGQASCAASE